MKRRKSDYQHFEVFERHNVFTGFTVIIFYKSIKKIETKHLMYNYNSMVDTCGCSEAANGWKAHKENVFNIFNALNTLNMFVYMKFDEIGVCWSFECFFDF